MDWIDVQIALFSYLRLYTLMLFSAFFGILGWLGIYYSFISILESLELIGQVISFIPIATASFAIFNTLSGKLNWYYDDKLKGMVKNGNETATLDIATKFVPDNIFVMLILYLFNLCVFLATIDGTPIYVAFMPAIVSNLFSWIFAGILVVIIIPLAYTMSKKGQRELLQDILSEN